MFQSKKNGKTGKTNKLAVSTGLNSIVAQTTVEGNFSCKSDIRIDGTILGDVDCTSKVIIGLSGRVNGDIRCKQAIIEGTFTGELRVSELLYIKEKAKVSGEVYAKTIHVDPGAHFNVQCHMDQESIKEGIPAARDEVKAVL